jgi:uncharacterized membrane protein YbaN (DUF454 family)
MFKRVLLLAAGWSLLVLGVAGLFLPILPGILLFLIGLTILSSEHRWAGKWTMALRRRFPQADRKLRQLLGAKFKFNTGPGTSATGQ